MKKEVQFHESRLPVSRRIVLIAHIFLRALFVLLPPASAAGNRYDSRWPCRQNITTSIPAVNGTRGIPANFPVSLSDLLSGAGDLGGVVGAGAAARKELS